MKLTNNLKLEMISYVKTESGDFENETATYEEAYVSKGRERAGIGYVIINEVTGIIPDEFEDMYPTVESAIEAVFGK